MENRMLHHKDHLQKKSLQEAKNRLTAQIHHKTHLKKKAELHAKNKLLSQIKHQSQLKKNQQLLLQEKIQASEIHMNCLMTNLLHAKRRLFAKRLAQAKRFLKKRAAHRYRLAQVKQAIYLAQFHRQKQLEAETKALHDAYYQHRSMPAFDEEEIQLHLTRIPAVYYSPWRFFKPANESTVSPSSSHQPLI
jgi:hypothetical protein